MNDSTAILTPETADAVVAERRLWEARTAYHQAVARLEEARTELIDADRAHRRAVVGGAPA